jgi:hypothetical protein
MHSRPGIPSHQLTIAELMVLVSGTAVGMVVYQLAHHRVPRPLAFGYREVVFACYLALSGVAMVAAVLMLVDRIVRRRSWSPPAMALFVVGLLAWCVMPFASISFIVLDACRSVYTPYQHAYLAYEPGGLWLAGFRDVWPVISLVLLGTCAASGRASHWWHCRGAWPEWLGMWMLAAWSLPVVFPLCRALGHISGPWPDAIAPF